MRFPLLFRRQKGSVSSDPALGSDASPPVAAPAPGTSNILFSKFRDSIGWPVQRICVAWSTPAGSPTPLDVSLYFWEEASAAWYQIGSAPTSMNAGQLYFFDTAAICERIINQTGITTSGGQAQSSSGGLEIYILAQDPGAQVNGVFTFVAGGDISTVGS